MDTRYLRQSGFIEEGLFVEPISVIGVGSIGSFVALTLCKMGFKDVTVWDFDKVEEHNLPNQFYRVKDLGKEKVEALREIVGEFEGVRIKKNGRWLEENVPEGIVILAVDNMEIRRGVFEKGRRMKSIKFLLDGRMAGLQGEVYAVDMADEGEMERYEESLWTDGEASEMPCGQKAIIFNVLWIASLIAGQLRLMLQGKAVKPCVLMDMENMEMLSLVSRGEGRVEC